MFGTVVQHLLINSLSLRFSVSQKPKGTNWRLFNDVDDVHRVNLQLKIVRYRVFRAFKYRQYIYRILYCNYYILIHIYIYRFKLFFSFFGVHVFLTQFFAQLSVLFMLLG